MPANGSEHPVYHLRCIGPVPQREGTVNFMSLYHTCSLIGWNPVIVDFVINSTQHRQNTIVSRCHAKIERDEANTHEIIYSIGNGVFINNIKIEKHQNACELQWTCVYHMRLIPLVEGTQPHILELVSNASE